MHRKQVDPAGDPADLAAVLPVIRAAHAGFVPGEPAPCGQRVRQWTGEQDQRTAVSFAVFADSAATEAVGVTMGGHAAHTRTCTGPGPSSPRTRTVPGSPRR